VVEEKKLIFISYNDKIFMDLISVSICTFRRPKFLFALLNQIKKQKTDGLFTCELVIVDNDYQQSGKEALSAIGKINTIPLFYDVEPKQNIARARNRAIGIASGNYVALIDDDEIPPDDWLLRLYETCKAYGCDAVLGPVVPLFIEKPPNWVLKSGLCDRPTYPTGTVISWDKTRTGNVLFRREVFRNKKDPFDPAFGIGGEDIDFFRRLSWEGYRFVWCNEAPVQERVPEERCRKRYFLRRAWIQGDASMRYHGNTLRFAKKVRMGVKAAAAAIIYTTALPPLSLGGTHVLMKYLVKDLHHISRLLALCGIQTIRARKL
jgi:succinoglycan biosynthesis protein ExoM